MRFAATLVAPSERGDEQPERDAPTLRYLNEITNLFEGLTGIVDGIFTSTAGSGATSPLTSQIRLDSLSARARARPPTKG